jgi:hypothetical protein
VNISPNCGEGERGGDFQVGTSPGGLVLKQRLRRNRSRRGMGDTAFDGSRDYDGSGKLDKEHVMRSKLAMEMMPWQMARLNPRQ